MKVFKYISLSIILVASLNVYAFLGGGEGSQGGGPAGNINDFVLKAMEPGFSIKIPSVKIAKEMVNVTDICFDKNEVRTFTVEDNYPDFIDIYKVKKDLKDRKYKVKDAYNISLTQKQFYDFSGAMAPVYKSVETFKYNIPSCD